MNPGINLPKVTLGKFSLGKSIFSRAKVRSVTSTIEYLSILILIENLVVRSVVVIILTSRSLRYRQSTLTVSLFLNF